MVESYTGGGIGTLQAVSSSNRPRRVGRDISLLEVGATRYNDIPQNYIRR